ncbi:MAG: hypothetical protein RL095_2454 [Verrucomicrobiota bacterium]|jgi:large subunit ribosomal protein L19
MSTKYQKILREYVKKDAVNFGIGDTVKVQVKIPDAEKAGAFRLQAYSGVVISLKGEGNSANVTVRRVAFGQGVERIFPLNSPLVDSITVERRGSVRRAKLYYLREKLGKGARIQEATRN